MNQGKIEQVGSLNKFTSSPGRHLLQIIGNTNLFPVG